MQTRFIRHANVFGQACKRVPCIAFVHVNMFAKFALACEHVCLRVRTRLAWRANAFGVRYTLHLGGTVAAILNRGHPYM